MNRLIIIVPIIALLAGCVNTGTGPPTDLPAFCQNDTECGPNAFCEDFTCSPKGGSLTYCNTTSECPQGLECSQVAQICLTPESAAKLDNAAKEAAPQATG
jgi:hypothetical protein